MEIIKNEELIVPEREIINTVNKPFIEANTIEVSLSHLEQDCIIPVFSKDNESTLSHQEFINTVYDCASEIFHGENILKPQVRTSHVVKGRIPSAIGKPVKELLENEKTVYYERMMFAIEIPTITSSVYGNQLNLVLGGVRAYNRENLYNKKTLEKFKFFIGFKNLVCCNMCVSSDGYVGDIRVSSQEGLKNTIFSAIDNYRYQANIDTLSALPEYKMSEKQFAQLIGKCRLYNFLPKEEKQTLEPLLLNDGQIASVAKGYYEDADFGREKDGSINLWKFYNLLTSANKSSYIDTFIERGVNAQEVTQMVLNTVKTNSPSWYLN